MNLKIETKKTKELTHDMILQINNLKNQHWNHTAEEHILWFKENIRDDDFHVTVSEPNGTLVAYLNLVNINIAVNEDNYSALGIGNVCVQKKLEHLGFGSILMASTNAFIKEAKTCGFLLCHDDLTEFYKSAGWRPINYEHAEIAGENYGLNLMLYDPYNILPKLIIFFTADRNF